MNKKGKRFVFGKKQLLLSRTFSLNGYFSANCRILERLSSLHCSSWPSLREKAWQPMTSSFSIEVTLNQWSSNEGTIKGFD